MRYPEPAPTTVLPMPVESRKASKGALQVPVSLCKSGMVPVEVPELTPDGATPTVIFSQSLTDAEELKMKAIKHADLIGLRAVSRSKVAEKAARSRWSATGQHL